jgi:RHS repeat-associated protein
MMPAVSRLALVTLCLLLSCLAPHRGSVLHRKSAAVAPGISFADTTTVDGNGSAVFTLPLALPAGTGGVTPQISLTYSSGQGDGLLGVGWLMSGMHSVVRCAPTIAQDGYAGGVTYTAADRFCLDGQRLVPIIGAQGGDGTVYRTEVDGFVKVVSNWNGGRACGGGPCTFTAFSGSGVTMTFGANGSGFAGVGAPSGLVGVWAVNSVTDTAGNFANFTYTSDQATGEYEVSNVTYSGVGLSDTRGVDFTYSGNEGVDAVTLYQAGVSTTTTKRLSAVTVKTTIGGASKTVVTYSIAYETGPATGRSRVKSITECGATGQCGQPLSLSWSDPVGTAGGPNYQSTGNVATGLNADQANDLFFTGDFFGDGRSAAARINTLSGLIDVMSIGMNGSVTRTAWQAQTSSQCASAVLVGDFTGNGLTNILCLGTYGSSFKGTIYSWNQLTQSVIKQTWTPQDSPSNVNRRFLSADVNGDGISDLVILGMSGQNMTVSTYLGTPSGISATATKGPSVSAGFSSLAAPDIQAANILGNGIDSLIYPITVGSATQLRILTNLTNTQSQPATWSAPGLPSGLGSDFSLTFGDLNGDGIEDPVFIYNSGGARVAKPYLSTGTGLVARGSALPFGSNVASVVVADFNGDNLDDIAAIQVVGGGGKLSVSLSGGSGTPTTWASFTHPVDGTAPVLQGDFSGRGFVEMIQFVNQGGKWQAQTFFGTPYTVTGLLNPPPPDLAVGFANGVGGASSLVYAPITNATVQLYTRGHSAVYPYQDVQDSTYVVAQMNKTDGMTACPQGTAGGHCFLYSYAYAGAIRNAQGRGWSGFTRLTSYDAQAERASVTSYATAFPFTNLVLDQRMNKIMQSGLVPMNERSLVKQYCTMGLGGTPAGARTDGAAADCAQETAKPANAFFNGVYQVQQVAEATSMYPNPKADQPNPRPVSTLTKTFNYDGYGNAVLVSDLGDTSDQKNAPVYTCSSYNPAPADLSAQGPWRLGYLLDAKKRTSSAGCLAGTVFSSWTAGTDLSWNRNAYTSGWLPQYQAQFLNGTVPDAANPNCPAAIPGGTWLCTSYTYDGWGNKISVTDPRNATSTYTYDSTFHTYVVTQSSPALGGGAHLTETKTYDLALGTVLSVTDPNGNTSTRTYDDFARPLTESLPSPTDGKPVLATQISYLAGTPTGWVTSTSACTDWKDCGTVSTSWYVTRKSYDGMGREYSSARGGPVAGDPIVEAVAFDAAGRVAGRTVPYFASSNPVWNSTAYDVYDRPILTCGPMDSALGQLTVQSWDYDNAARTTTRRTFASASCQSSTAGAKSQVQTTVSLYTARGLLVSETAPDNGVTTLTYDALGRIVKRAGPMDVQGSDTTTYVYDSLSQTISQSDPTRGTLTLAYDSQGSRIRETDGAGNVITATYDVLTRPLSQVLTDPKGVQVGASSFGYDAGLNAKGHMSSAANEAVSHTMAYDRMGNQSVFTTAAAGLNLTFGASYDPLSRQVDAIGADASVVRTTYGGNLLPTAIDYCAAGKTSFTPIVGYGNYTSLGKYQSRSYGNGLTSAFTYDVIGRTLSASTRNTTATLSSTTLTWGAATNPANVLSKINDTLVPGQSQTLGYDLAGRLTSASGPYPATTLGYDKGGNILTWQVGSDKTTYTMSQEAAYRLGSAAGPGGTQSFQYLGNGALEKRTAGQTTLDYAYTPDSYLSAAKLNGTPAASMTYGPARTMVTENDGDGTATLWLGPGLYRTITSDQKTLWTTSISGQDAVVAALTTSSFTPSTDASSCLGAMNRRAAAGVIAPVSPSGSSSKAWTAAALFGVLFLFAWGTLALGGQFRRKAGTAVLIVAFGMASMPPAAYAALVPGPNGPGIEQMGMRYFNRDTVLSPSLVTDATGKETARVAYLPFGTINQGASSGVNDFREKFGGKNQIGATGLLNFGARVYDPSLGRFLTPDPAGQYDNPYSFAGNDPYGRVDTDGRFSTKAYFGGIGITHRPTSTMAKGRGGAMSPGKVLLQIGKMAALIAISVAFPEVGVAIGVVFTAYDTVKFIRDPSLENGVALGFDLVTMGIAAGEASAARSTLQVEGAELRAASGEMKGAVGESPIESGLANERAGEGKTPLGDEATCGGASFAAGTMVATRDGSKPVEDVRPGDMVLTSDQAWRPVQRLFTRQAEDAVDLTVGGELIHTTAHHPFLSAAGTWVEAGLLEPGQELISAGGGKEKVEAVRPVAASTRVYNMEVADLHVYAVGEHKLLAHNPLTVSCYYNKKGQKTYAETTISKSDLDTGTDTSVKTRDYVKTEAEFNKFKTGKWDPNSGLTDEFPDAGHIFANRLGGSGKDIDNIFPQSQSINRGGYRVFEGRVYDYVKANGKVSARVDFSYVDSTRVPSGVRYRVWQGKALVYDYSFANYQ